MRDVEYLRGYYPFDDEVMATVEEVAHGQRDITWPEYAAKLRVPELEYYDPIFGNFIEIVDIKPQDYDETYVYHQPMGCSLDSYRMMHVATLSAASPDKRIISVSNPGRIGRGTGEIPLFETPSVWFGNLEPAVQPTLEYMDLEEIESAVHIGESYGAEKAMASAAGAMGHEVVQVIATEPVAVASRGLTRIGGFIGVANQFIRKTSVHAERYLEPVRALSDAFVSAEELKEGKISYALGLARLSNIAIGGALGWTGFEDRAKKALIVHRNAHLSINWGENSELAIDHEVSFIAGRLKQEAKAAEQISTMRLAGQTHSMNLDPFLNTALVLQAVGRRQAA